MSQIRIMLGNPEHSRSLSDNIYSTRTPTYRYNHTVMIPFLQQNILFSLLFTLIALTYWVATRLYGEPSFSERHAVWTLVTDIIVMPILVVIGTYLLGHYADRAGVMDVMPNIQILKSGLLHLVTFWFIARALDLIVWRTIIYKKTRYHMPALLRGLGYSLVMFVGLSAFLWKIDYPLTGILVSTGVIAGVLGFALQHTINDLFSGIALSLEQPFKVGDWIELEDKSVGQVIDITWRSTRLLTLNSTIIAVPNSRLASQNIGNLDKPSPAYGKWHIFKISPDISPELVTTILMSAVNRCPQILTQPAPIIRLSNAEENPYEYSVWVHYVNYLEHFRGSDQLYREVHLGLSKAAAIPVGTYQEINLSKKTEYHPVGSPVIDTLRSLPIFSELNEYEFEQIAALSEYIRVEENALLLVENQPSNTVYVIVNGSLESSVIGDDGKVVVGNEMRAGDSFGWTALLLAENAVMTVRALSDCMLLAINGHFLKPILATHPELMQHFTDLVMQRTADLEKAKCIANKSRKLPRTSSAIRERIERFISSYTQE